MQSSIITDLPCGGAPGIVYKRWGQVTKDFGHSNVGDLYYSYVIKQGNIIDSVQKCAYMSWQLCWCVMCKRPSHHISRILK